MFTLNEKVVYPGHGVAQVSRIIKKQVAGNLVSFFELKFLNKDMTILVPLHNAEQVGIRKLCSDKNVCDIFKMLSEPSSGAYLDSAAMNWNKRNKEYQGKLRTGDLREICAIYRDLKHIAQQKELSFGEKNLLHQTEALLVEEIALVQNIGSDKVMQHVRSLVAQLEPSNL